MALNFNIIKLSHENKHYTARARFCGIEEEYIIETNALLFHNGLDTGYNFMICNAQDRIPENGEAEEIVIKVSGKDAKRARMLEEALIEFMFNQ